MEVVTVQELPRPVFEVHGFEGPEDFNIILSWLRQPGLPQAFGFSFQGSLLEFHSDAERLFFTLGFEKAWDLLDTSAQKV